MTDALQQMLQVQTTAVLETLVKAHGEDVADLARFMLSVSEVLRATNTAAHTPCGTVRHESSLAYAESTLEQMLLAYSRRLNLSEAQAEVATAAALAVAEMIAGAEEQRNRPEGQVLN